MGGATGLASHRSVTSYCHRPVTKDDVSRDRFATRAALLESAEHIIATQGVSALGVNALANAAKCDKVLIYRYFGGLDGVLAALGAERQLWPNVAEGEEESLGDAVRELLLEEWAALAADGLELRSAAAEAAGGASALATAVARQRSDSHERMIAALRERHRIPPYVDLPALVELVSAALTMFALRARSRDDGRALPATSQRGSQPIDPGTDEGMRRVEKLVGAIVRALLGEGE